MHPGVPAPNAHVEGQSRLETVVELPLETKSFVPAQRRLRVRHAEDGDDLFAHGSESTQDCLRRMGLDEVEYLHE
jgi:hypothetical protein